MVNECIATTVSGSFIKVERRGVVPTLLALNPNPASTDLLPVIAARPALLPVARAARGEPRTRCGACDLEGRVQGSQYEYIGLKPYNLVVTLSKNNVYLKAYLEVTAVVPAG